MKAYKISCGDDDHGQEVHFAERGKDLRGHRHGDCDCEYVDVSIKRAPEFDKYSPGPVTIEQYLEHGWFWRCQRCEKHCYLDSNHVIVVDTVFCSLECVKKQHAEYSEFDPATCHESIRDAFVELDEWLKSQPETTNAT